MIEVFKEYQKNFKKDVQKDDYKLFLKTNNLIIKLLCHLIKKNQAANKESIIIKGDRVEIILDLSGFEKTLISESLREISYLGDFEIAPFEYHIGLLSKDSYNEEKSILKLDMLTEVFIPFRRTLLNNTKV